MVITASKSAKKHSNVTSLPKKKANQSFKVHPKDHAESWNEMAQFTTDGTNRHAADGLSIIVV